MIDHTAIGVANVARSAAFYDAVLGALGTTDRPALERICTAYASIDYATVDAANFSIVCLGVADLSADVLKRAEAVNTAKAALREICAPLQRINMRVPVKGDDGPTKAIPVIRVILRNIQRSDLTLHSRPWLALSPANNDRAHHYLASFIDMRTTVVRAATHG
jgi:hypothetical protein